METLCFIINYFMTLLTTAIFGVSNNPFSLKPVRINRDERPDNRRIRTEN